MMAKMLRSETGKRMVGGAVMAVQLISGVWAAIVGPDIAKTCHGALVGREDIRSAISAVLAYIGVSPDPPFPTTKTTPNTIYAPISGHRKSGQHPSSS